MISATSWPPPPDPSRRRGPLREIVTGIGMLPRGFAIILRRPKLFWLGALPPLITSVLMIGALVALGVFADDIATVITPFADDWGWVGVFRQLIQVALVLGALLLMVITFSALALAIGTPMYDKIAEAVDDAEGGIPAPVSEPTGKAMARASTQVIGVVGVSLLVAVVLFVLGFIPVVGQTVVPVLSACFGGWMLTIELLGSAFSRRGRFTLAERTAAMRGRRLRCLGFGVPCFLLLSIPMLAVIVFPAATAGGTLLARSFGSTGSAVIQEPRIEP